MKKATKMWLIIGGSIVGGLALLFIIVGLVFRVAEPRLKARVAKVYSRDSIVHEDYRASNFGVESRGPAQLRGNGALILTAHQLHFFPLVAASDFQIPLERIKEVKTVRAHLGKTVGRQLLHVSFTVDGGEDAVAFSVSDIDVWLAKLGRKPEQNVR